MPAENGQHETPIKFSHQEVVKALLRARGITEGRWALYMEFGPGAVNVGPDPEHMNPAALTVVQVIGVQRVEGAVPAPGLVDASRLLIIG
jgi:hypothetical protein